jgi:RNA polymerase sigma-70 factor (ECF subfamily)
LHARSAGAAIELGGLSKSLRELPSCQALLCNPSKPFLIYLLGAWPPRILKGRIKQIAILTAERETNHRVTKQEVSTEIQATAVAREATAEVIARILAGETQLFHQLIKPVERGVFVMLYMLLRNETDAEDVAQETFIKIYRNLQNFRGESKFSTWVLTIARNEGLGWLRKRSLRPEEPLEPVLDESRGDFTPALLTDWREVPPEALERKELRDCLGRAILGLPPIYRDVVQLRDIDELDVQETANVLGITPGSVKVRLHRARTMLQKELVPVLKSFAPATKRGWFGRRV